MQPPKTSYGDQRPHTQSVAEEVALGEQFMAEYSEAFEALAKHGAPAEPRQIPPSG